MAPFLGARYTEEKRSGFSHRYLTDGFGGSFVSDQGAGLLTYVSYSETFDDTSPMAALAYEVTPDINFYALVARGFKSGGFSSEVADPAVNTPFEPQTSLSKEIGMKSQWLDGSLRLLLDYSYTDMMYLYAVNKDLSAPNAGGSYVKGIDEVPSTQNLNMRLQLADVQVGDGTMDFSFFVRNLTDEDERIQSIDFSMFMNGTWQAPRTYMFTAAYNW